MTLNQYVDGNAVDGEALDGMRIFGSDTRLWNAVDVTYLSIQVWIVR